MMKLSAFKYFTFWLLFICIDEALAMGNDDEAESSSSSSNGTPRGNHYDNDHKPLIKAEIAADLFALLNLKTQIQMDYMTNESTTMELVNEFNKKYAKFVMELPNNLIAKSKFEKKLHKINEKLEQIQFKNEIDIVENNLLIMAKLENKFKNGIEQIECSENVYEVVQYHLERVNSELYRRKHYKYKLLLLSKWNLPISTQKLINVFDSIQIILTLCGFMDEVAVHQDTRSMIAKMMAELKEVEKSLAQKLEIDQKLLVQIQRLDRPPSPWECLDEMQIMARLDHIVMSHGKISLIYLHACALRLASELGILINELEEIGTEWTSADAIDEVLKSAAGLEMNRLAILKM